MILHREIGRGAMTCICSGTGTADDVVEMEDEEEEEEEELSSPSQSALDLFVVRFGGSELVNSFT